MLKFIHLTDLHLTANGERAAGYDTYANTDRALSHALDLFPDAAFVVITGDIANWGEYEAYRRLERRLELVPVPVFLMIGNHDNRDNFFSVFGRRHPFAFPYAQYRQAVAGYELVFLDTQGVGSHAGRLSPERLAWLDETLSSSGSEVLLFMHHHPVELHAPALDAKGLTNWSEFHTVLARHRGKIRHIFHGHCHILLQGNVEGVSFTGLRSMSDQAYTDLKLSKAARLHAEPHYGVAVVTPNSVVVHLQEFNYSGPLLVRERQRFEDFIGLCAERGVAVPGEEPSADAGT
ncbi:metallophosphoesterase [Devosia nitrariae]|uniref:3',5'-cyclic adenosine monophosphate phosphodiesterase CpdA n=1 Tax=Devosia nitrariae TaxID=2071872 RepID=A0ABQ5W7Q5_9HYPH|nr:metallophosphoesterase [Devosia nitrariae]GLQ55814.1 3',5'-cyclic adenosine monophosphate phosphodiesterase CpdA [Devosia nitrariae]